MSEERKQKDTSQLNNINTIVSDVMSNESDDNNEYIEKVLDNAKDSIEKAKAEERTSETKKKSVDININEEKTEEGKRKLVLFEKIIIGIFVTLPLIQVILLFAVTARTYFIYSVIAFILITFLSVSCKQYSMMFVDIAIIAMSLIIVLSGFSHGMNTEDLSKKSVTRILYLNSNTQNTVTYEDLSAKEIKETLSGKFIYYYKYGCKDCLAVETQIISLVEAQGYELVPVETRSDFGRQLLDLYNVNEVPAGLVISDDGTYDVRVLYTKDENDNDVVDTEQIGYLFERLKR